MQTFIKTILIAFLLFLCPKTLFAQSVDTLGSVDSAYTWDSCDMQYPMAYWTDSFDLVNPTRMQR